MQNLLRFVIACILSLTATTASAQGFSFSLVGGFDNLDHLEVPVQFGGRKGNCMVDTGARFSIVRNPLLSDLPSIGLEEGGGISGVSRVADLVQSEVQIGTWKMQNLKLGRTDLLPAECLIGNNVFLTTAFQIDFQDLEIHSLTEILGASQSLQVYTSDIGGEFGFDATIAGASLSLLFDTGATDTVIDSKFISAHLDSFTFVENVVITEGSDQQMTIPLYTAKSFAFGTETLTNIQVFGVDLGPLQKRIPGIQGILGLNVIKNYDWNIDPLHKMWQAIRIQR